MSRLAFYESPEKKTLSEILIEYYVEFREYLLKAQQESLWYQGKDLISPELLIFLENHETLSEPEKKPKNIQDELVHWFTNLFNLHNKELFYKCTTNPLRFSGSKKAFEDIDDLELHKIWQFIIKGRSLNNEPANEINNSCFSYLSRDEQKYLEKAIRYRYKEYIHTLKSKVGRLHKKNDHTNAEFEDIWMLNDILLVLQHLGDLRYGGEVIMWY